MAIAALAMAALACETTPTAAPATYAPTSPPTPQQVHNVQDVANDFNLNLAMAMAKYDHRVFETHIVFRTCAITAYDRGNTAGAITASQAEWDEICFQNGNNSYRVSATFYGDARDELVDLRPGQQLTTTCKAVQESSNAARFGFCTIIPSNTHDAQASAASDEMSPTQPAPTLHTVRNDEMANLLATSTPSLTNMLKPTAYPKPMERPTRETSTLLTVTGLLIEGFQEPPDFIAVMRTHDGIQHCRMDVQDETWQKVSIGDALTVQGIPVPVDANATPLLDLCTVTAWAAQP